MRLLGLTGLEALVLIFIGTLLMVVIGFPVMYISQGAGVFGPTLTQEVMVTRLYVDNNSDGSHYMVGTDKGVFEVDNGLLLWIWNADEIYSELKEGGRYIIVTEGNKVVNPFFQEYPYITSVKPLNAGE